jgi:hypothetical protein
MVQEGTYATLTACASTEAAKGLVKELAVILVNHEREALRRTQKRGPKKFQEYQNILGAFLCDLLRADGPAYRSLDQHAFKDSGISYSTFRAIVESMVALGFLKHKNGARNYKNPVASRYTATEVLKAFCLEHGEIHSGNWWSHFRERPPVHPLVLKASSTKSRGQKKKGVKLDFEHTQETRELEAQVKSLNDFLMDFELAPYPFPGYIRIFNCGDTEDFAWNKGGRLYCQFEDSYMTKPKSERLEMTIDNEPVVEIDVRASYLTILFSKLGVPFDPTVDPYALPNIDRSIVKAWTIATLGNDGFLERWPPKVSWDYLTKTGKNLSDVVSASKLQTHMVSKFPALGSWDEQIVSWSDLMFYESTAMMQVMLGLKDRGVPSLTVHDSLIVRAKDAEVAVSLLKKQYHNDFGVTPWLTISKHEKDEKTTKPEVACVSRTVETPETTEARSNPDCGYDEKSRGFTEALQLC